VDDVVDAVEVAVGDEAFDAGDLPDAFAGVPGGAVAGLATITPAAGFVSPASAALIGIVSGTYSSIFNASTLLVAWEKARASRSTAPPAGRRRVVTRTA